MTGNARIEMSFRPSAGRGSYLDIWARSASGSGRSRHFERGIGMTGSPQQADIISAYRLVGFVPCVDGSELARAFFTFAALVGAAMCSAC